MSFTTSNYESNVEDKGIVISSPKLANKLYTNFFPVQCSTFPSPAHVTPAQGFQDATLGLTLVFKRTEFIQILNASGQRHWVTTSTIGTDHPVVNVSSFC